MNTLLQFKEWLTIEEASNYLTIAFNELVKPDDLYRLAIENKLILSLFFVNNTYIETAINDSNIPLVFTNNYQQLQANSYCDLVNCHNSTLILKQHYYNNTAIPLKADSEDNRGIILLLDNFDYGRLITYSETNRQITQVAISYTLPKDIYLIVKTDYLLNFVKQAKQPVKQQTELHNKERISLYKLIALLTDISNLAIDKEFKTADLLINHATNKGIENLSRVTIAKYLKEASLYLPEVN